MADKPDDFSAELSAKRSGGTGEIWAFLKNNKKWWLLPILVAVVLLGALVVLGGTAAAPFIYTLF
jgi:hypothetical protein